MAKHTQRRDTFSYLALVHDPHQNAVTGVEYYKVDSDCIFEHSTNTIMLLIIFIVQALFT